MGREKERQPVREALRLVGINTKLVRIKEEV